MRGSPNLTQSIIIYHNSLNVVIWVVLGIILRLSVNDRQADIIYYIGYKWMD